MTTTISADSQCGWPNAFAPCRWDITSGPCPDHQDLEADWLTAWAQYYWEESAHRAWKQGCAKCRAGIGEPCRKSKSGAVREELHASRIKAGQASVYAERPHYRARFIAARTVQRSEAAS